MSKQLAFLEAKLKAHRLDCLTLRPQKMHVCSKDGANSLAVAVGEKKKSILRTTGQMLLSFSLMKSPCFMITHNLFVMSLDLPRSLSAHSGSVIEFFKKAVHKFKRFKGQLRLLYNTGSEETNNSCFNKYNF